MNYQLHRKLTLGSTLLCLLCASTALAAPAASVPSLFLAWGQAFLFGFVLYAAGTYKMWLGALLMLFPVVVLLGTINMHRDEVIRAAAVAEHGEMYFPFLYAAEVMMLILGVLGIVRGIRQSGGKTTGS